MEGIDVERELAAGLRVDQLAQFVPVPGRASSSDRMSSSAEPFFSSRSSARVLITVINRYSVDRNTESTHAIGGHR